MAKTAKLKKKPASIKSRAARRETSPSLNLDKSLKTMKPPSDSRPSVLAPQSTGIIKKTKKSKPMSRAQRLRHEKAMENAERDMDKHERKIERSKGRGRKVQERAKNWEELNGKIGVKGLRASKEKAAEDDGWIDEGMAVDEEPEPGRVVVEKGAEGEPSLMPEPVAVVAEGSAQMPVATATASAKEDELDDGIL
ncbi:hypothetical protein W97_08736 [Coniosporium apollinis CBS 100218]|uniref:Ribosome biogenesis protein Alb1 n=1 Tax=Coniosporium apollinis (strain CBS 100218) TaxID=1168221 RepID=R7Z6B7_CONA1|nr:uncharacterized protein W97_08736 [Coniosporium apollinis CBS 100218]EON69476.1 hypothetical protein W97_08736 [Coniosporium apollinis CBS 100218]